MIVHKPVRIDLARPARTVVHCMQTDKTQRVDVSLFVNNRPYDVTADVASGETVTMAVAYILPNGYGDQYTETALGETAVEQDSTIAHLYHVMIDGACTDVDGFVQIIVKFTTDSGQVLNSFPLTLDVIKSQPDDVDPGGNSPALSRYLRVDLLPAATGADTGTVTWDADNKQLKYIPGSGGGGGVPSGGWGTSQIADEAITTAKLAASAVTSAKIGSGAVTEAKIGAGAVTNAKIGSEAVTTDKLSKLVVEITEQNGGYTPSHNFNEVRNAIEANKKVEILFHGFTGDLIMSDSSTAIFDLVDATDPAIPIKYQFTMNGLNVTAANISRYVPNPAGGTAQNPSADKGKVPTVGNTGEYELKAVTFTAEDVLNAAEEFTTGQQNSFRGYIRAEEAGAAAAVQTNLSAVTAKIPSAATESNQLADKAWVTGMVGAPKKAATVADMTDTDSIYVYTGSETGYVAGNWYYHDQGSWLSGGAYNAVAVSTDTTLSQQGEAADAAATGRAIDASFYQSAKMKLLEILRGIRSWRIDNAAELIDELEAELFPEGEVVSIEAVYTQDGAVVYAGTSLDALRADLVVTATLSDQSTRVITDYTLTGTLAAGTSTVTVHYRDLTDTFSVTVTAAPTEVSITALYTQGSTVVTPYTPLNSLKSDLVVMVNYSNTTSRQLDPTEYTLSGTLTEGTSTVDVAYNGLTDEFTVTVGPAPSVPTGFDTDGLVCCLDGTQINDNFWYNLVTGVPFVLHNVTVETDGVTFAGTADSYGESTETFGSALTIEVVYKAAADSGNYAFFGTHQVSGGALCLMHSKSSGKIFSAYNSSSKTVHVTPVVQYGMLSATRGDSNSPAQIAVLNGTTVSNTSTDYTTYPSGGIVGSKIGTHGHSSMMFKGEILMVCIYNKRKTAAEMQANQAIYDSYYNMGILNQS